MVKLFAAGVQHVVKLVVHLVVEPVQDRVVDLDAVLDPLAEVDRLCLWSMLVVAIVHWLAGPVRFWIDCRLVVVGPALHRSLGFGRPF